MKRKAAYVITLALLLLMGERAYSQIGPIKLTEEVEIDKFYLGLLSYANLSTVDFQQSGNLSFRAGGRFKMTLVPKLVAIRSFGVLNLTNQDKVSAFTNFETIITPHRKLALHIGVMATPATELRPNPTTWQSQVETTAESSLPGGRPGVKIHYKLSDNLKLSYGLHSQNKVATNHLKLAYKKFSLAAFSRNGKVTGAAKWTKDYCQVMITAQGSEITYSTILPAAFGLLMQTDMVYNTQTNETTFSNYALRKYFESEKKLSGFFSIGYNPSADQIQGGFFIHI